MQFLSRRAFLGQAALASLSTFASAERMLPQSDANRWRGAIIGCTGQGDYGHGLDMAFDGIERVEVLALADPNEAGRTRAAQRAKAQRQYSDYRQMLGRERPELVVVAPRWSEKHFEIVMAALQCGAHVLTEKPFTVTLAEADQLLATAQRSGLKVAVAHQMRLAPCVVNLQRALADGLIGELVHIRAWGKQDARAGGEDMMVLGTHIFDLMRLLAGDALSCTADVLSKGQPITRAGAHAATEKIGPIAGDEVEARFRFAQGVTASFTSRGPLRETLGHWGLELLGSKGAVLVLLDIDPVVLQRQRREGATPGTVIEEWLPVAGDSSWRSSADERGFGPANRRVVLDWIDAVENRREPQCSGYNAAKAIEFVMAAYQAALDHKAVAMPLANREHPLA